MAGSLFKCPYCSFQGELRPGSDAKPAQCPSCGQRLAAPPPNRTGAAATPGQPPSTGQAPGACPLCGLRERMREPAIVYGSMVCTRCRTSFAGRRWLAHILDLIAIQLFLYSITLVIMIPMTLLRVNIITLISVNAVFAIAAWPLYLLKDSFAGYSLGKAICGVRVVDAETGRPGGPLASFKRNLPLLIPFMPLIVFFTLMKGRRIGDKWARSMVIWEKHADTPVFATGKKM